MTKVTTTKSSGERQKRGDGREPAQHSQDEQMALTVWFFFQLSKIYGSKYSRQYPDDSRLRDQYGIWQPFICAYTQNELQAKLENAMLQMAKPEFAWPNIGAILNPPAHLQPQPGLAGAEIDQPKVVDPELHRAYLTFNIVNGGGLMGEPDDLPMPYEEAKAIVFDHWQARIDQGGDVPPLNRALFN